MMKRQHVTAVVTTHDTAAARHGTARHGGQYGDHAAAAHWTSGQPARQAGRDLSLAPAGPGGGGYGRHGGRGE